MSLFKEQLRHFLSGPRQVLSKSFSKSAGVALLICGEATSAELLFIKRSHSPKDHWSGHLAFPGGKMEPGDATLLEACLREVQEEIGLHLTPSMLVGSLDDLQATRKGESLDFYIQPFVFYSEQKPHAVPCSNEVADIQWVPLRFLQDKNNQTHYLFEKEGRHLNLPGIAFPSGDILWGLSHRMTLNLLEKLKTH